MKKLKKWEKDNNIVLYVRSSLLIIMLFPMLYFGCNNALSAGKSPLSSEEEYKVHCYSRWNSEVLDAEDPEFYSDEQIAVVGRIVGIENDDNKLIYHISDEGLSDGGGIWRFEFNRDSFNVGDMIIIYGSGATAMRDPDYVKMNVRYMDIYRE